MKFLRTKSLKIKIVWFMILILVILFSTCIFYINEAFDIYNVELYESKASEIQTNIRQIESELKNIESLSEEYMVKDDLQNNLYIWSTSEDPYYASVASNKIYEISSLIATRKRYIKAVMIENMEHRKVLWSRSGENNGEFFDSLSKNDILMDGSNYWILPDNNSSLFTSVRCIKKIDDKSFSPIGKLYITFDFAELIESSYSKISEEYVSLLCFDKKLFYTSGSTEFNEISKSFYESDKDYELKSYEGTKYFLVKLKGNYNGYGYVALFDFNRMFSDIVNLRILIFISFAVLFVGLILISFFVTKKITRRIDSLRESMKEMEKGNFRQECPIDIIEDSNDEIDIMVDNFYKMGNKIDNLINENYNKVILLKETELKNLHSQLKPHFLYNTLETINWMAISSGQKNISAMVKALGHLLRNSIDKNQYIISIHDEISLLKDYILIQKYRFGDLLSVEFDVDETLEEYSALKMSVQILVENSIKHVLENNGELCKIKIGVREENGVIELSVKDSGTGIDEETIKRIKKGIHESDKGIGLSNIEKRIKLIYGEKYGLTFKKEKDGASVIMQIPKKKCNSIKNIFDEENKNA